MGVSGALRSAWLVLCLCALGMTPGRSRAAEPVPFGDQPVRLRKTGAHTQALEAAASGLADTRGKIAGQVVRARTVAGQRARAALHRYVDRVLAASGASAAIAERVHEAVTASAEVVAERQLSDGSIVQVVRVPLSVLDRAWPAARGHWQR